MVGESNFEAGWGAGGSTIAALAIVKSRLKVVKKKVKNPDLNIRLYIKYDILFT